MSQLGVKHFVVTTLTNNVSLANLVWSGQVQVLRQRPKIIKLGDNPSLILGRCTYDEKRLTNPRGSGQKQRGYSVDVLAYATWPDEQTGGDSFDIFVERTANVLESASVPMYNWPDPVVSGVTSNILEVGERARVQMVDPIQTGGANSRIRFGAVVTAYVTEILQG